MKQKHVAAHSEVSATSKGDGHLGHPERTKARISRDPNATFGEQNLLMKKEETKTQLTANAQTVFQHVSTS